MSTVAETFRRVVGRSSDVAARAEGLHHAVEAARGRLDPALLDRADAVVQQAEHRLRLSGEHTVVALAGATGSGKSSLFNALCGLDLAAVGVKRPTTSWALACAWGPEGATELLDWLGIPKRHQVSRMGMLDESRADRDLQGLVLLDLPDHDSTEVAHHLEVERLVQVADVLLWVLDPQKYADAAIHDRFLRPLQSHADVMMVTLNHVDELPAGSTEAALADVRRLLVLDGLGTVPLFGTSATRGDGLDELRRALADRVSKKKLGKQRLTADIKAAAELIGEQTGTGRPHDIQLSVRSELADACADAAGVPVVVAAVESASLMRGHALTGWPVVSWLSSLRRDPMRKLNLDPELLSSGALSATRRTTLPAANSVQRARVASAVRRVADDVTEGMSPPWERAVRSASVARMDDVAAALDSAVARTDLGVATDPWWCSAVRALQWVFLVTAAVGALWLLALAGLGFLQTSVTARPDLGGLPVPTLLLVGGVVLGLLLALVSRAAVRFWARRRAVRADVRLRSSVAEVTRDLIVAPMQAEIAAFARCRDGVATALKR